MPSCTTSTRIRVRRATSSRRRPTSRETSSATLNRIEAPYTAPGQVASEDLKKLASLGYLAGGPDATGPLPDPRASLPVLEDMRRRSRSARRATMPKSLRGCSRSSHGSRACSTPVRGGRGPRADGTARGGWRAYARRSACRPRCEPDRARARPRHARALASGRIRGERPHRPPREPRGAQRSSPAWFSAKDLRRRREARLVHGGASLEARGAVVLAEVALRRDRPADALALRRAKPSASFLPRNLTFLTARPGEFLATPEKPPRSGRRSVRTRRTRRRTRASRSSSRSRNGRGARCRRSSRSMYLANPSPSTARLAARTLESMADREDAARWARRERSVSALTR